MTVRTEGGRVELEIIEGSHVFYHQGGREFFTSWENLPPARRRHYLELRDRLEAMIQ